MSDDTTTHEALSGEERLAANDETVGAGTPDSAPLQPVRVGPLERLRLRLPW